jgi:hypothetical protein
MRPKVEVRIMGSFNNKWNRRYRAQNQSALAYAAGLLRQGKREAARTALESAKITLGELTPFNGGSAWQNEHDRLRLTLDTLKEPCECFFCSLSSDRQQKLAEVVGTKEEDLASVYGDEESNFTGAYAEVVFGFRYNLPVNQVRGFDGGKDFSVPCAKTSSGTLTIDVKGTSFVKTEAGDGSTFPWIDNWNSSEDHIYVLLQVVERKHVFFCGFAFGNDRRILQVWRKHNIRRYLESPGPVRTLKELEELISDREHQ